MNRGTYTSLTLEKKYAIVNKLLFGVKQTKITDYTISKAS